MEPIPFKEALAIYNRYPKLHASSEFFAVAQVIKELETQLAQATERAIVASDAYDGQQTSYRELEGLYHKAVERLQNLESIERGHVKRVFELFRLTIPNGTIENFEQVIEAIERTFLELRAERDALAQWACEKCGARFASQVSPSLLDGVRFCSSCAEAQYWHKEIATIREAAANAIKYALQMVRPRVAWEAELAAAEARAKKADAWRQDIETKLFYLYAALFPGWAYENPKQAIAIIEREWIGMHAAAVAMADALQAYFNAHKAQDTPEYISAMAEALSAWGLREQNMPRRFPEEAKEVSE